MTDVLTDDLDAIMQVMGEAFDPAFGEGWTRKQISDALALPNTHYTIARSDDNAHVCGFTLSRHIAGEEELLLIAVSPACRKQGIGTQLLRDFCSLAKARGASELFLEMRDGNIAAALYRKAGFEQVGRRRNYYCSGTNGSVDALTFKRNA